MKLLIIFYPCLFFIMIPIRGLDDYVNYIFCHSKIGVTLLSWAETLFGIENKDTRIKLLKVLPKKCPK